MKYFVSFFTICFSVFAVFITVKKSISSKNFGKYAKDDEVWVL